MQSNVSSVQFFEGRKELATVEAEINRRRLKAAARFVKTKELQLKGEASGSASDAGEGDENADMNRHSSPPPNDEIIDLTEDEGED